MTYDYQQFYDGPTADQDRRFGWYWRLLRRLSFPLSRLFLWLKITPLQATAIGTVFGGLSAGLAALGGPEMFVLAAVAIHAARLMDLVDGNLARAYPRKTWSGKFLDGLNDSLVEGMFLVGVGIGLGGAWMAFAFFAAWFATIGSYASVRYLYVHGLIPASENPPAVEAAAVVTTSSKTGVVRFAQWGLAILGRTKEEITLPGFVIVAVFGRADLWLGVIGSLVVTIAFADLLRTLYLTRINLNILRS